MEYGDYSFYVPADESLGIFRDLYFDNEIIVERKANLDEIIGNLTGDKNRLKKELALAPPKKILIIEDASYADMVNGKYRSSFSAKSMFGSYHSLWHEFDVPIIMMPEKKYTGMFMLGYFQYYLRGKLK